VGVRAVHRDVSRAVREHALDELEAGDRLPELPAIDRPVPGSPSARSAAPMVRAAIINRSSVNQDRVMS
jgi:hypothetical protein